MEVNSQKKYVHTCRCVSYKLGCAIFCDMSKYHSQWLIAEEVVHKSLAGSMKNAGIIQVGQKYWEYSNLWNGQK